MGYALNLGAWNSVFAVPSALIDRYMKTATGDQLKVILWLLRNNSRAYSTEDIAGALGIPTADADRAIRFWVDNHLLTLQQEPLTTTLLPDADREPPHPAATTPKTGEEKPYRMIRPDGIYVSERVESSEEMRGMVESVQTILGRPLSPALLGTLVQAHDDYGLPCEVIVSLVSYAQKIGRAKTTYINSTAKNWADSNILTLAAADERIRELDQTATAWRRCESAFGLSSRRAPSKTEGEYAYQWIFVWHMPDELLEEAYERCVDKTGKFSMRYIHSILKSWFEKGIRTLEDANAEKQAHKNKTQQQNKPSFDLDEIIGYDIFADNET